MTDSVETALRRKKDSSLRVAVSQVKPHADRASLAQACVSAGNTGALMAVSRYVLKTVDGIDRPAIATVMPNEHDGFTTVLDLGANVDCTAEHLLQFAVMGSALVAAVWGKEEPTRGPAQHRRGSDQGQRVDQGGRRAAARRRRRPASSTSTATSRRPTSSRERPTSSSATASSATSMLKTAEGLASMLTTFIKQEFKRTPLTRLAALAALPVLNRFKHRVDPRRYNGAALLGLRGLVFKSHGSADAFAFEQALNRAYDAARNGLLDRVQLRIRATLAAMPGAAAHGERPRSATPPPSARSSPHDDRPSSPFAHQRHRQLPAAAIGSATPTSPRASPRTASRPRTSGSSSAPASAFATSPRPTSPSATWR